MLTAISEGLRTACESSADNFNWSGTEEALRYLRNNCARKDPSFLEQLRQHPTLLEDCFKLLKKICTSLPESITVLSLRIATQFIGNFVISDEDNNVLVWDRYFQDFMDIGVRMIDSKARNYFAMAVRSFILNHSERSATLLQNKDVINIFIEDAGNGSEFAWFLVETLIKQGHFKVLYDCDNPEHHLFLLEAVHSMVNNSLEGGTTVGEEDVAFLIESFRKKSDYILKTIGSYAESLEPREVAKLLSVLCSLSGSEQSLKQLQGNKSLFINSVFLLKSVHSIGKQGPNQFSVDEKNILPTREMELEPTFNFKGDLIRLIGNMVYKNTDLQNLARELECIPFLLDCCKIDAKNPFILQWSIFAIRNLCENNVNNKAAILKFEKQSDIGPSVISQLGLTLHSEGERSIGIVPLIKK